MSGYIILQKVIRKSLELVYICQNILNSRIYGYFPSKVNNELDDVIIIIRRTHVTYDIYI